MVLWPQQTASHIKALQSHNPRAVLEKRGESSLELVTEQFNISLKTKNGNMIGCENVCCEADCQSVKSSFLERNQSVSIGKKKANHLLAGPATCLGYCRRPSPCCQRLCLYVACLELQAVASPWHPVHLASSAALNYEPLSRKKHKENATLYSYGIELLVSLQWLGTKIFCVSDCLFWSTKQIIVIELL